MSIKEQLKNNLKVKIKELKEKFDVFNTSQKYNSYWKDKCLRDFDTMLEFVSIITRKRTILLVRALNNLAKCEPIFYKENAECIEILKKEIENFYKNFYCSELDRRNLRRKKNFLFNNGFHLIGDGVYYQKTNKIRIELSLYNTYTYEEERYVVL